jgi:hypothetical protein
MDRSEEEVSGRTCGERVLAVEGGELPTQAIAEGGIRKQAGTQGPASSALDNAGVRHDVEQDATMIANEAIDETVAGDRCGGGCGSEPSVKAAGMGAVCAGVCEGAVRGVALAPGVCPSQEMHAGLQLRVSTISARSSRGASGGDSVDVTISNAVEVTTNEHTVNGGSVKMAVQLTEKRRTVGSSAGCVDGGDGVGDVVEGEVDAQDAAGGVGADTREPGPRDGGGEEDGDAAGAGSKVAPVGGSEPGRPRSTALLHPLLSLRLRGVVRLLEADDVEAAELQIVKQLAALLRVAAEAIDVEAQQAQAWATGSAHCDTPPRVAGAAATV